MNDDLFYHTKIKPDDDLINEIFTFNPRKLEVTPSSTLSMYCLALNQYLVYFRSQYNALKVDLRATEAVFFAAIEERLKTEEIRAKKFKTKASAQAYLIEEIKDLYLLKQKLDKQKAEFMKLEGLEKYIEGLIHSFKGEVDRKKGEQVVARWERK